MPIIKDIYNSIASKFPSNSISYTAPPDAPIMRTVNPEKITDSLRYLESNNGTSPNTPRNQIRNYMANKKPVQYNIGYGGEFGITPIALSELNRIHKIDPQEIQTKLMSPEGAGSLANLYFNRVAPKDYTPETLASHYIEKYMGKGTPNDTPQNRKRVLDYYNSISQ